MEEKHPITKKQFLTYGTIAIVAGVSIYFLASYLRAKAAPPIAKIANDIGDIKVLRDSGPLAGIPTPKAYTTKGAWCVCPGGSGCNGKANDCSCCNDVPGSSSGVINAVMH